ncbi:MAG: hypothetical protein JW891_05905 [Candidatus Lokiarchaeota archaeon]|nr:hypothetical protein [Candidatus Lokiarchaeota archaeon]
MTENFKILEVTNVMKAGRIVKIKTWEEFIEIAKNNKVDKVYKYGKLHFMLLSDGVYQIKKKK